MSLKDNKDSKRVAKNTLILYFRMLLMMFIGLYTSRINLKSLGVEDFGIYNVVGGIVVMFSIINGSITSSISRFITFELGTGNIEKLKKVFSTSITIQIGISLVILLFAETIGLWFLQYKMTIPEERIIAANWVYQFSIISFILNLISTPYNACIISHERMSAFAWISIFDATAQLLVAWFTFIVPMDKLIFYAGAIVLVALINRFIYYFYCKHNFEECSYKFLFDKEIFTKMFGFAGWNFIGASSAILRDTGGNIVINLFCGPSVNAARGIASQVNKAVMSFASSFMTAINPQITKSYACGENEKMLDIIHKGAKYSFFLLLLLGAPVMVETEFIIHLWLGQIPEHTISFVRLAILFAMSEAISNPLITAMLATGKIKNYQIVVGGFQMLNLPLSYIFLRLGFPPESVLIIAIAISQCCFFLRLFMLRPLININVIIYLKEIYVRILSTLVFTFVTLFGFKLFINNDIYSIIFLFFFSIPITIICILYIGCTKEERGILSNIIKNKILVKLRF